MAQFQTFLLQDFRNKNFVKEFLQLLKLQVKNKKNSKHRFIIQQLAEIILDSILRFLNELVNTKEFELQTSCKKSYLNQFA